MVGNAGAALSPLSFHGVFCCLYISYHDHHLSLESLPLRWFAMFGGVRDLLHSPNTTLSLDISSWVEFCLLFFIMYNLIFFKYFLVTIYTRDSLYTQSMPSRFFKHHSYVLSSPILIRYTWIHFLLAWFSWRQVNCLWRDDHPPLTRKIFWFVESSSTSWQSYISFRIFIIFLRIRELDRFIRSSLFWTVIIYSSIYHTHGKPHYAARNSIVYLILSCLDCREF